MEPILRSKVAKNSKVGSYKSFAEYPSSAYPNYRLGTEVNSNQFGRVFQGNNNCTGRTIYNLNVKGKRGNIVETFPAVQYDYAPSDLYVTTADCVHVQWTGSDYNPARNSPDAYGGPPEPVNLNLGTPDRKVFFAFIYFRRHLSRHTNKTPLHFFWLYSGHHLVQTYSAASNFPVKRLDQDWNMFVANRTQRLQLAFIGQSMNDPSQCIGIAALSNMRAIAESTGNTNYTDQGDSFMNSVDGVDRFYQNCAQLSGARVQYFYGGLFAPGGVGAFSFMNTRVNSFGN